MSSRGDKVLAFMGSRHGHSSAQQKVLHRMIAMQQFGTFAHGDVVCSCRAAHYAALDAGLEVEAFPADDRVWQGVYREYACPLGRSASDWAGVTFHDPRPAKNRIVDLLEIADALLAFPWRRVPDDTMTWFAVRLARRVEIPTIVVHSDGTLERR